MESTSSYCIPNSFSASWSFQRCGLDFFNIMFSGIPKYFAISLTCNLYSETIGVKSDAPSPNFVKYPIRCSLLSLDHSTK